jgi:PAS domain S-box-containing protein
VDEVPTLEQLAVELAAARRRIAELEATAAPGPSADEIARLQALLNETEHLGGLGGWEYDVASGRGVWTDEVYRIHGLQPGVELSVDEAIAHYAPEARPQIAEAFRRAVDEGQPYDLELPLERADGRRIWVRTLGRPEVADGAVVRVHGNIMDVTDRKRAEEELRAREGQYRVLVENLDDVLVRYDLDLRYRYVSPAMVRVTGMRPDDLIGKTHREAGFPEPLCALFDEALRRAVDARHAVEVEFETEGADGRLIAAESRVYPEFDSEGRPASVVTITRDVTSRKRAEEALRRSETSYRIAVDNTYDWEWWEAPDGSFVYCSPGCKSVTGYEREEFTPGYGRLLEIVHPDDRERVRAHLLADADEQPEAELEFRLTARDGSERIVEHRCRPVYDDTGSYLGRRGSNRDVTEHRAAEAEIRRLNEELQRRVLSRTEQLDAATRELEALAYSVAHDVRAPLRTIDGFSAAVMEDEGGALSDEAVSSLQRVRAAAQTLARLLDDLTGLSRASRRELVRQAVDLSALAEATGREIALEHQARSVELLVAPGLSAEVDPVLTRIIFRELLGNAWKFTASRQVAHVEVGALDVDGQRAFFVRDDGVGFDMRFAGHLFGVFQRMHPPGEFPGDGVGLAMVQRLVRRHGGRCWAEAEVGRGATLFFTLPPDG